MMSIKKLSISYRPLLKGAFIISLALFIAILSFSAVKGNNEIVRKAVVGELFPFVSDWLIFVMMTVAFMMIFFYDSAMPKTSFEQLRGREEELERQVATLEAIINCMDDGVVFIDAQDRVALANNKADQVRGARASLNKSILDCHLKSSYKTVNKIIDAFRQGRKEPVVHPMIKIKDRYYESTYSPVVDHQSQYLGTVLVSRDITERRETEEQLRQHQKMASIGMLVSGIAHEVNNPIGIITAKSDFLLTVAEEPESLPIIKRDLKKIKNHAQRVINITQELLCFSRTSEEGKRYVDINTILSESLQSLQEKLGTHQVKVSKDFSNQLPKILANAKELQRALTNIMDNAIDSMPKSGLLKVSSSLVKADKGEKEALDGKDSIEINIEDKGCGIPERIREKIFDPFFTTKDEGQGTGLGLWISYNIIEKLGGHISIKGKIAKGSVFVIRMPVTGT